MPGTVNRRGGTPTHRPSRAPAGAHRPRSLFELQDVRSVATNAVKPHLNHPSILLSDGFRSLPERGFAAALTNLDAARSLRPCGLRGRAARAMRRRMGRPGPSRRSDCAVGVRAFLTRRGGSPRLSVRPLHGDYGQPAPAELRLLGGHGPRPHSILWHPSPVLDQHGHDPSGHAHRPVGRRCGA
mgnify:CR=1 FL=1